MITIKQKKQTHPDLTKVKHSVGQSIEDLVKTMDAYRSVDELKAAFLRIVENEETAVSKNKIHYYHDNLAKMHSLNRVRSFVTNVYLNSANLGLG